MRSMFLGQITFNTAGPIKRLPDGRMQFPHGGSIEYRGVERRIQAGDELALVLGAGVAEAKVLVNGVPLDEIGLDS